MSEEKLVTIRRCGPVWEAEMLRDRLETAGIRAFVQGAESNRTLSYAATALGGVKVQVAANEVAAAEQVLTDDELQRATAGSWQCPRCDEINDAAFDVCWNCSMPRGDSPAGGRPPDNEDQGPAISVDEMFADATERTPETFNPYQSLTLDKRIPDPDRPNWLRLTRIFATVLLLATITVIIAMAIFAFSDPR